MFRDRLKTLLGSDAIHSYPQGMAAAAAVARPQAQTRASNGLEQFFAHMQGRSGLRLLDLSGCGASNIPFITNLGHNLYFDDFLTSVDDFFGIETCYEKQRDERLVHEFLGQTFGRLSGPFDGALLWDGLQFLRSPLLEDTVRHLHRLMQPGGYLLAYFNATERAPTVLSSSYRIETHKTLQLVPRGLRVPSQYFTNRMIEKVFADFDSVKFFLTRDHIREVLIKR